MAELPAPPTLTLSAIYAAYEAQQGDGFRDHLGASLIGVLRERHDADAWAAVLAEARIRSKGEGA